MTKAKTKGAKQRQKAATRALGGLRTLYAKFEREAAARTPLQPQDDPLEAPTQARRNQMGAKFSAKELLDASNETEAGKALAIGVSDPDERRALFDRFMEYDKAITIFHTRVLGRVRYPAVSRMEFMPERLEASASDHIDLRTEDERAEAAKKDMALWDHRLAQLHPFRARIIRNAHCETFVVAGELNGAGRSFIAAMRALQDIVGNG